MNAVKLERRGRLLSNRQELYPSHSFDFFNNFWHVMPVKSWKWLNKVNLKALNFGHLSIIFQFLFHCCSSCVSLCFSFNWNSLSKWVVSVYYSIYFRRLVIWIILEQKHLPFNLRVWICCHHEVIIKLNDDWFSEHLQLAVVWQIVLWFDCNRSLRWLCTFVIRTSALNWLKSLATFVIRFIFGFSIIIWSSFTPWHCLRSLSYSSGRVYFVFNMVQVLLLKSVPSKILFGFLRLLFLHLDGSLKVFIYHIVNSSKT